MKTGMIGLGRMGMNMGRRLLQDGHQIVAFNCTPDKTEELVKEGAEGAFSLRELVKKLPSPKVVWMMLPAEKPVNDHLKQLRHLLSLGDIIVEGGNSRYKDDIRRIEMLKESGIHYLDAGVSCGIWGLKV